MLYIIPTPKCYSRLLHRPSLRVSVLRSWKETVYASTHTRYQHFDRQSMKRACPWQRLLLHMGDKTTIARISIVWTTTNTLNVSIRHLTTGLCEEHCRRLQNTVTLWHSPLLSLSLMTHIRTYITCLWEPLGEFIQNLIRISEQLSHHKQTLPLI